MKYLLFPLLLLVAGCVPEEVHQADRAQIAEHLAHINELQGQLSAVTATTRLLEVACVVNGMLVALCIAVMWKRSRKKGGPN